MANLESIEQVLHGYYNHTTDQILLRNSDSSLRIEEALQRATAPKSLDDLKMTVKKLVAVFVESDLKGRDVTEEELKQSLHNTSKDIKQSIETSMEEVNSRLSKFHSSIATVINSTNIWKAAYTFSPSHKHPDVKVLSPQRVKATSNSGYKFVLMEPSVGTASHQTFSFKVMEASSNWLAVGFCHRNVVQSNNYSFVFGSVGHGAYLMSSNGGSWSHFMPEFNNTIKAIKFGKGDTVHALIDQSSSKISFSKNAAE